MRWVAFFRNLNLGHPGSPTRPQLEAAFAQAGAGQVRSFQTNGTIVFDPDDRPPEDVVRAALPAIEEASGWADVAPCLDTDTLADIVGEHGAEAWQLLLNVYDRTAAVPPPPAGTDLVEGLRCVSSGPGWVLSRLTGPPELVTDPNPVVERITGQRNTTRSLTTIVRLTRALGLTTLVLPPAPSVIPDDLVAALAADPSARQGFAKLPPSQRRQYGQWVASAKQPATRAARIVRIVARCTPRS